MDCKTYKKKTIIEAVYESKDDEMSFWDVATQAKDQFYADFGVREYTVIDVKSHQGFGGDEGYPPQVCVIAVNDLGTFTL